MKTEIATLLIISALVVYIKATPTSNYPPCVGGLCNHVTCDKPGDTATCHPGNECHCHSDVECNSATDCIEECPGGPVECEKGHCHGPTCSHT